MPIIKKDRVTTIKRLSLVTLLCLLQGFCSLASYGEDLEVLHWWTSDGERAAALYLQDTLAEQGITWVDAAIPGGGGEGAMAVLKSRVLQGAAPAAAQIIGPDIQNWAALGFLGHFNIVALAHDWPNILHPTVNQLLQYQGQYVAVPFGIHRINGLWVNRALLAETGLAVPQHWDEFFTLAEKFQAMGVIALVHGNEPWQNATLFETLVLSVGGPSLYRAVFEQLDETAILSDSFAQALSLLSQLKGLMDPEINGRTWPQATRLLADGQAGMQIMGDWVGGELTAWQANDRVLCASVPETAEEHLYSIDTMVMFKNLAVSSYQGQLNFAETMTRTDVQLNYNRLKGSVPVRLDIEPEALSDCAQISYRLFKANQAQGTLAPSLAHSMVATAEVEDVFVKVIHEFFQTPNRPVLQVQQELVRNLKSIRK